MVTRLNEKIVTRLAGVWSCGVAGRGRTGNCTSVLSIYCLLARPWVPSIAALPRPALEPIKAITPRCPSGTLAVPGGCQPGVVSRGARTGGSGPVTLQTGPVLNLLDTAPCCWSSASRSPGSLWIHFVCCIVPRTLSHLHNLKFKFPPRWSGMPASNVLSVVSNVGAASCPAPPRPAPLDRRQIRCESPAGLCCLCTADSTAANPILLFPLVLFCLAVFPLASESKEIPSC